MAIDFIEARSRKNVAVISATPLAELEGLLNAIGFRVAAMTSQELAEESVTSTLAGVVFVEPPQRPLDSAEWLRLYGARLLDQGCPVFVLATPRGHRATINTLVQSHLPGLWAQQGAVGGLEIFDGKRIVSERDGIPPMPHVQIHMTNDVSQLTVSQHAIAQMVLQHGPDSRPASTLTLNGPGSHGLADVDRLMLRRAFHDCEDLYLVPLADGNSQATVLLVHAKLAAGARRPSPYFAKIDRRLKITKEYLNYVLHVQPYIPFHLAPRLLSNKCFLGAQHAILVGDFVEDSEGLGECVRSSRASAPVAMLFERTLRGWHYQREVEELRLFDSIGWQLRVAVPKRRRNYARANGMTLSATAVRDRLAAFPRAKFWVGTIHGDLHAENIRARASDAILIDFYSATRGPLISDAAALESSFLIRVPDSGAAFDTESWKRVIDSLFTKEALSTAPALCDPREPYSWLSATVRQVRLHALALQFGPGQYAKVLAYRLFNAASKDPRAAPGEDFRRAHMYRQIQALLEMSW